MHLISLEGLHKKLETINVVRFVIADHDDPLQRKEWISGQIAVDEPTVRNGAILRSKVLEKARDVLDQLAKDFSNHARQTAP